MRKTVATILSLEMTVVLLVFGHSNPVAASEADLILYNGKIVTIDSDFSIRQAMAVKGNNILQVGNNKDILRLKADKTEVLNLDGKTVLPGFIDSHAHPCGACMTEFDHPIPQMDSIEDVLSYFRKRADALEDGEWIIVQQVFITRLREQRYPTREELDGVASESNLRLYQKMLNKSDLTVRVSAQYHIDAIGALDEVRKQIRKVAENPLFKGGSMQKN